MIGAARSAISKPITSTYSVSCSPSEVEASARKGTTLTPYVNSFVVGGVGPFEYLWEVDSTRVTALTPTEEKTKFRASGIQEQLFAIGTLTVTDTGNGDLQQTDIVSIIFNFGVVGQ